MWDVSNVSITAASSTGTNTTYLQHLAVDDSVLLEIFSVLSFHDTAFLKFSFYFNDPLMFFLSPLLVLPRLPI